MKTLEQRVTDLKQKVSSANESTSIPISDLAAVPSSSQSNISTADDHISTILSSNISKKKERVHLNQ